MRKRIVRLMSMLLLICAMSAACTVAVYALSWDGDSAGGGGKGSDAGPNGYAVAAVNVENCVGYRFSLVDSSGANKVSKVIDVYRNTGTGNSAYSSWYKFAPKYNKKQLINNQNAGFSTEKSTVNCYKETDMGFQTALPGPSEMSVWQNYKNNLNSILSKLGAGSIDTLKKGDKILVEPMYNVRLESVWHTLTVTEMSIYGKHILGANSNGGGSSTPESWGFIAPYVNQHYPNVLFTPDGQGLWDGVSASKQQITFANIINKGYGVGIAYTEEKDDFAPALAVKECRAYKGYIPTKSFHYGTSTGNTFSNWTYVSGYPVSGDNIYFSVYFPKESENVYVRQTIWVDGTQVATRTGYSWNFEWYDVVPTVTAVSSSKTYYSVKARIDWIEKDGTNKRVGVEKTFYIPVKPVATREKVTAYNLEGTVQAYSGMDGSSGTMYFGQRVSFQYLYGAKTTWTASFGVKAIANRFNGSSWEHIYTSSSSGEDVSASAVLSSTRSVSVNSSIGTYRIPRPSGSSGDAYRLKFDMSTVWGTDMSHTKESSTYYLPIAMPDVALYEIKLIKDGRYVDPDDLTVGDKVTVRYVYKNNTDCAVYVEGYNDDKSKIDGIYKIPAGGTANVNGAVITVPDKREFSVWGGVYLEGAGIYNTDYESDGTNNSMTLTCKSRSPLTLTPITPNADYREGTDVVTSYWINNDGSKNYIPDDNVSVRFRVYNASGTLIRTVVKDKVIVPARDKNLIYFKWTVPSGLNRKNVTIKADIFESGKYYALESKTYRTIPYLKYTAPDTRYEEKRPTGFSIPYSAPVAVSDRAVWWEYSYEGGRYVKKTYGVEISNLEVNTIFPGTGYSADRKDGVWIMKSGYGISALSSTGTKSISGYLTPDRSMITEAQYAYITLPEYRYVFSSDKCWTLERSDSNWILPENGTYGRVHFTPLWYPDGDYTAYIMQSDMWTPYGMIKAGRRTDTIVISGSAYDDWYAGER